ncbi:MAG: 16S rRNA (cytidine(1402)-2'-O)-methyltransferase [Alphaproteobacteria bacterium]|nr:16S rRNA (cytidine(1402)-2'-O)-methyltransferase [Alphaproteobacteria bacterium]
MDNSDTKKHSAWLLPDRGKKEIRPGLYLIATPIGNLADISLRALDTLAAADLIVCEDTRVSGKLLSYYGLKRPLLPYNDHNADRQRGTILRALESGQIVALISDAGTPLVSDPGYKLVRACREAEIYVTVVPGASAVLSGVQLSGLPAVPFTFLGFLPSKSAARRTALEGWKAVSSTLVLFEAPQRLTDSLQDILSVLGDRPAALVREITKLYEEARLGMVSGLLEEIKASGAPKGEQVIVIGPPEVVAVTEEALQALLAESLKTMTTKEAAAFVAQQTGHSKKQLYEMALALRHEQE